MIAEPNRKSELVSVHQTDDKICMKAMVAFASTYGQEAGNCALKYMPYGDDTKYKRNKTMDWS